MAVAELGYKIYGIGVEKGQRDLKEFSSSADRADKSNVKLTKSTANADAALSRMAVSATRLVGILASSYLLRGILNVADSWERMSNMAGVAVRDMERAGETMDKLTGIARRSYSSMQQTVDTFSLAVPVFRNMGKSADEAADYVESLNLMLVAGYVEGQRAESVQRALNKAMAVGKLDAAGLESVLSNSAEVSEALANELGVTTNQLYEMSKQGKITGDVISSAVVKRLEDMRDVVAEMPYTLSGAMQTLRTEIQIYIGHLNNASGVTATLAQGIVLVAENIGRLVTQIVTATAAYVAYRAAILAVTIYTKGLTAALIVLRGALIRSGIGIAIVAAGELVFWLSKLVERTGGWGNALKLLGEVAAGVWEGIVTAAQAIPPGVGAVWQKMKADFLNAVGDMIAGWNDFIQGMVPGLDLLGRIPIFGAGFQSLGIAAKMAAGNADAFTESANRATVQSMILSNEASILAGKGFGKVNDSLSKLNDTTKENEVDTNRMMQALLEHKKVVEDFENLPVIPTLPGGGGGGGTGGSEESNRIQQLIESLQTEQEIIAQWYAQAQLDLMLASDAELELIGGRNEAKLRLEQEYQDRLAQIRGVSDNATLNNMSSLMGSMASLAKAGGDRTFKIWKAFSIAQATIDSYRAFTQVLADPAFIGRPWARGIAAASVLASGLAQVASIASTKVGGGSAGGGGGGGGRGAASVPQQAPQAPPQTRAIIQATGGRSRFTIEEINDIISGIQKESKDGVIIEGFTS